MVGMMVGCLTSPVDLIDVLERLGRVLQPRRDPAVAGMDTDDGIDVAVEHGERSIVLLQQPTIVTIGNRAVSPRWLGPQGGAHGLEACAVGLHAHIAEGGAVGDRIDLEVVDIPVELELDHPVDQLARGDPRDRSSLWVQREQSTEGIDVPFDAAAQGPVVRSASVHEDVDQWRLTTRHRWVNRVLAALADASAATRKGAVGPWPYRCGGRIVDT